MFRPRLLAPCLLAVCALVLGACGSGDGDDTSSPIDNSSSNRPDGEPIVLGLDEDSTSAGAAYSMVTAQAVRDTVDKINDEGGVLGRPLEIVVGNSGRKAPMMPRPSSPKPATR